MSTEALALLLQLPPLAFGPAMPTRAYEMPRELTCAVHELGQIQAPARAAWHSPAGLDAGRLSPEPERHLFNPVVEFLVVVGALASTRGSWDDRSWSTKRWEATGAVTPVLIPPQAPPVWGQTRWSQAH